MNNSETKVATVSDKNICLRIEVMSISKSGFNVRQLFFRPLEFLENFENRPLGGYYGKTS